MSLESNMKRCTDCNEPLPLSAFPLSTASQDGRRSCCTECRRKRNSVVGGGDGALTREPLDFPKKSYEGVQGGMLLAGYVK